MWDKKEGLEYYQSLPMSLLMELEAQKLCLHSMHSQDATPHNIVLGRDERIQHGQHGHLLPSAKDTFLEMDDSPTDILPECLINIDGFGLLQMLLARYAVTLD